MHAIAEADARFFEAGSILSRVLDEAPYLSRCSDNKTAARIRPREYAIRYPYMQINRPGRISWLIFDLDHSNAHIWDDVGLPAPNLIVRNRSSGASHLYYAIPPVCTSDAGRERPIAYMKAVYAAFALALSADPDFHGGPVAKTPSHPWWDTEEIHSQVYELGQLADYVELASATPWGKAKSIEDAMHSRHCLLFEHLRHYAYSIVGRERHEGTFDSFCRWLRAKAVELNRFEAYGFDRNLPESSLRATVRSVSRWTWAHYDGRGRSHRGVMALDQDLDLPQRQSLAAARTHKMRQEKTASKIRQACITLSRCGESLTQSAIGRIAGVSRQTVAAYRAILDEYRAAPVMEAAAPVLEAEGAAAALVKYAAHQVPAVGVACKELFGGDGIYYGGANTVIFDG